METLSIPMTDQELPVVASAFEALLGGPDARTRGESDEEFVSRILRDHAVISARLHVAEQKAAAVRAAVMQCETLAEAAAL